MTDSPPPLAAPNWYPDPQMPNTLRYWDGLVWTEQIAPRTTTGIATPLVQPGPATGGKQPHVIAALVMVGSVIGLVMAMQSTSFLKGAGVNGTGAAIACGCAIATWAMRRTTPRWVRVAATVMAVLAMANFVAVEVHLEMVRQSIPSLR